MSILLFALALGFATGLRSMTGPAAVAWAARLEWLHLGRTGFAFLGQPAAVVVLTLAALGEFVGDKLPKTPARTAPGPLGARIVFGGLCGAALGLGAGASGPVAPAALGALGAILGTLGGYAYRMRAPRAMRLADFPFAVVEDLAAVGLAFVAVAHVA